MQPSIATTLGHTASQTRRERIAVRVRRTPSSALDADRDRPFLRDSCAGDLLLLQSIAHGFYDHFLWQADAFLNGRFPIDFPVSEGPFTNAYMQDIMPLTVPGSDASFGLLPFPPLRRVALDAVRGRVRPGDESQLVGRGPGRHQCGPGVATRRAHHAEPARGGAGNPVLRFRTVHLYASMLSTTWFLAHVVAITFVLLGMTLAIDAERAYAHGRWPRQLRPPHRKTSGDNAA